MTLSNASVCSSCGTSPILRARRRDSRGRCRGRRPSTVPPVGVTMPADDADQRRLAGAVRAEQREDLALVDVEVDRLQRLHARRIGLAQAADGDDRWRSLAALRSLGRRDRRLFVRFARAARPCRISIGTLASAKRKVAGRKNQNLKPTQKSVLLRPPDRFVEHRHDDEEDDPVAGQQVPAALGQAGIERCRAPA